MENEKELKAIVEKVSSDGTIRAIASLEEEDRDGDIVSVNGIDLKNFKKNSPVLWMHNANLPAIGRVLKVWLEGKKLMMDMIFDKADVFAMEISRKLADGFLNAFSIGFIANEMNGNIISKSELLEVSVVNIPANAGALISREYKAFKAKAEEFETKGKLKAVVTKEVNEDKEDKKDKKDKKDKETEQPVEEVKETEEIKEPIEDNTEEIKPEIKPETKPEENEKKEDDKEQPKEKEETKEEVKETEEVKSIRWNKSLSNHFNKEFDVEAVQSPPATFEYDLFSKFLDCKVKNIFINSFTIPSPLLGSYLSGFKEKFSKYELKDTRSFDYKGAECPPINEVVKLNSKKSDDFLIEGVEFYNDNKKNIAIKYAPTWFGINVSIVTNKANKGYNKELLEGVHEWVSENNYLKGEKFSLSGEFLEKTEDKWDDVVLEKDTKDNILKSVKCLDIEKGKASRGMMFVGVPGTGKTKTGRILMNDSDSTFIWVTAKDFYRVGVEKGLSLAFDMARDLGPSTLFIEDIDKALIPYGIDTLKTEMDGLKQNKNILTILTTNDPANLPKALLDRPGRFHDILDFKVPSSELRKKMIEKWAGEVDEKLLEEIVSKTDGYSGAHMKELIDYSSMIAEDDSISIDKALIEGLKKLEKQRLLVESINTNNATKSIEVKQEKLKSTEDTKNMVRNAIDSMNLTVEALKDVLANSDSKKGDKTVSPKTKVEEPAEKKKAVKKTKLAYRVLESLLQDLKQ